MTPFLHDRYKTARQPMSERMVLILTANHADDIEFFYPYYRFIEGGFRVDVATPCGGPFLGEHGTGLEETKAVQEVKARNYHLLYIPGGKATTLLKKEPAVLQLVHDFLKNGIAIAAICNGPEVLAEAEVIRGHKIAAWPEIQQEIEEKGATYTEQDIAIDGPFITARMPGDLPLHMALSLMVLKNIPSLL